MFRHTSIAVVGFIVAAAAMAADCAPGPMTKPTVGRPMNKPVELNASDTSGSLEAGRRQLQGTWTLVSLEYAPTSVSPRLPIVAKGTLTYDEYGNLTIDAHTDDPNAPPAAREKNMLSFRGRAVIDTVKSELKMMDLKGNADPNEVLMPEYRRHYEIKDNTLTLSSFDDKGNITIVSVWRRQ